jgi:hypothetical protein
MNYAMMQSYINYSSNSDAYGVPSVTRKMDFPANNPRPVIKNRTSYVTPTFDGICQICHRRGSGNNSSTTNAAYFNRSQYQMSTHNAGTVCSACHAHSGSFAGAGDCTGCHGTGGAGTSKGREDIQIAFGKKSHHVKASWASVTKVTCSACHMEANTDGSINSTYHTQNPNQPVDLVVYGTYPTRASSVPYRSVSSVATSPRLNAHCLSCHNTTNGAQTPFSSAGDNSTPSAYDASGLMASDGGAAGTIADRYSNASVTTFSKYSSSRFNVVPQIAKAFSPHGNPSANKRGNANNGQWADDAGTNRQTGCFDCHNSHGSNAGSGNTTKMLSYSSAVGGWFGGNLKQTSTYTPTEGSAAGVASFQVKWSASADLCWSCHLGDNVNAPLKYNTASPGFGMKSSIDGYWDAGRWRSSDKWTGSFSYKSNGPAGSSGNGSQKGGHFGGYSTLRFAPSGNLIDGRCTVCHDPHGVNPAKTSANYRVPALKGTWMTSPYKEDRAASRIAASTATDGNTHGAYRISHGLGTTNQPARFSPRFDYNNPPYVGNGYGKGVAGTSYGLGSTGWDGYFIDDNTFGTSNTYANSAGTITDSTALRITNMTTAKHMVENETQFAGLCLNCHAKASLLLDKVNNGTDNIYVHNTVKGWYSTTLAADLFKPVNANGHLMSYNCGGGSDDSRQSCAQAFTGDPGTTVSGGYRWAVKPGTADSAGNGVYTKATPTASAGNQTTTGYKQVRFHQFPCSKCHTAHTSKMPRLMKTNCMDVGATYPGQIKHVNGTAYTYPVCDNRGAAAGGKPMTCHNQKKSNYQGGGGWNTKTGW